MISSDQPSRFRYRLRTLLLAAPLAAWLMARWLAEPVSEVEAWIMIHDNRPAAEVRSQQRALVHGGELDGHATAVKSETLLARSLEPPEIASLPIVKRQSDAIRWLHDQLHVEVQQESGLVRISLRGRHPDQLGKILHSIAATYSRATRPVPR